MSRKKFSSSFKRKVINEYEQGGISCYALGKKYGVDATCIRSWVRLYRQRGETYLTSNHANINYPAEFKQQVVTSYLEGGKTYRAVADEFNICAPTTVRKWVLMYNDHEDLNDSRPKGMLDMAKNNARKTDIQERIDAVEHCLANNKNYALTAQKFQVSYGQIYSWVKKYQESGVDGLIDRRGKRKPEEILSDEEKLQAENRMLKAEIKKQQMEIDFLKKLKEIEGR